jgi:hypothetical protein
MREDTRFIIFSCGFNCQEYANLNVLSVQARNYKNYLHIIVDDASPKPMKFNPHDNQILYRNKTNQKWIKNALMYLPLHARPDDVIVILDLDDHFASDCVLRKLNRLYKNNNYWMTYSRFRYWPSSKTSNWIPMYDDTILEERSFRKQIWSWTHLRTFKYGLFTKIKDEDLKDSSGEYIQYAYDMTTGFPMLEMSGKDRIGFIPEILCNYNIMNALNVDKIKKKEQMASGSLARSRTKYAMLEKL